MTHEHAMPITGHKCWSDQLDATLEERLEKVSKNLCLLKKEQVEHAKAISALKGKQQSLVGFVEVKAEELNEKINEDRKALHTGDLIPALFGLIWIGIGVVSSTFAQEFEAWMK